ncbi:hypothetical protein T439DRAFT_180881 [Meredithblackwellia eburnea MCA 4105]
MGKPTYHRPLSASVAYGKQYRRLLIDKLFPSWGIENSVEWYWVKVTSGTTDEGGGRPVWPIDSSDRKCYEGVSMSSSLSISDFAW